MNLDRYDSSGFIENGKLRVRHRQAFEKAMKAMTDGEVIVSVRHARATRSVAQNALYWRWYVAPLSEYTGYSPQAIHSYLKQRFISAPQIVIANADGEIVDEATIEPTTTTLTKVEFSNFLDAVKIWALDVLDLTIGAPVGPVYG